ncbi:MAG: hypothetical protein B7733_19505 [Myxococcales bacterium FL481]|nr:MAG: hypothetical protein B7733_19505 [Myxococcales bacterium FL481]
MYLERVSIVRFGPFDELTIDLLDRQLVPRPMTVVWGEGGLGKTTLVAALACTRPGNLVQPRGLFRRAGGDSWICSDWRIGEREPPASHSLRWITPNAGPGAPVLDAGAKRMQAVVDRRAAGGRGYVFVALPGHRQFAPASLGLVDPARTLLQYDVRTAGLTVDSTRPELTRPCKQALSFAGIVSALAGNERGGGNDPRFLGAAMREAVNTMLDLAEHEYTGVDALTLEPRFRTPGGASVGFEGLASQLRHLISFVALPTRALWAAHGGRDPRGCAGVVVIDDAQLLLSDALLAGLVPALRRALPRVQWVLTTNSPTLASSCAAEELVTLRRLPSSDRVESFTGDLARCH